MKPVVSAMNAWSCTVVSIFAILILGTIGLLFNNDHHSLTGGTESPHNNKEVATTIFVSVLVYAGFLVFCGFQALLHKRQGRRGQISLN